MKLKRSVATITAGLLTGAAALGFGLGTAEADPVEWTANADSNLTITVPLGDPPLVIDYDATGGTFTGEVDEDLATITGSIDHGGVELSIPGLLSIDGELQIADIDLDWNQDDDSVSGTATLQLALNSIDAGGDGPAPLAPCAITASADVAGTFDAEEGLLEFSAAEFYPDSIEGECGGEIDAIAMVLGEAAVSLTTTVGGEPVVPEETTTTTEAPAEETPSTGGAAPIAKSPAYTG